MICTGSWEDGCISYRHSQHRLDRVSVQSACGDLEHLISTGVYRFPAERAARIAVSTAVDTLKIAPTLRRVIFCCFSKESAALHEQALAGFGKPCAD